MASIIDEVTGDKIKVRKWFYLFSHREIYQEAIKHPRDGGFAGFRDPKDADKIWVSLISMERILPSNVCRMTSAQKSMCGCEVCLDGRAMFTALIEFRRKALREFDLLIAELRDGGEPDAATLVKIEKARDDYVRQLWSDPTKTAPTWDYETNKSEFIYSNLRDYTAAITSTHFLRRYSTVTMLPIRSSYCMFHIPYVTDFIFRTSDINFETSGTRNTVAPDCFVAAELDYTTRYIVSTKDNNNNDSNTEKRQRKREEARLFFCWVRFLLPTLLL
jgi:hypothetical protein